MANKIWNKRVSGIVGAVGIVLSILWSKLANWLATRTMLGNIKSHGINIVVMRGCTYRYPEMIELGDDVIIGKSTAMTAEICNEYDTSKGICGHFIVNQGVSIGNNCEIDFSGGVTLKKYVHIAHNVQISTHDHGYDYRNKPIGKYLEIDENAFIGSRSVILHNCNRIGKNAVIGTGSVVTKNVPDNAIVAGNPAKIIKYVEVK